MLRTLILIAPLLLVGCASSPYGVTDMLGDRPKKIEIVEVASLGGKLATGRVAEVYVKVAQNVYLAADRAPPHLRDSAERWIDVEFPELLANGTGSAHAIINRSDVNVAVGDVVEIKFAHKDNPRYFPVKELTRVTEFVAGKDQMLARDMERRILARTGHGNAGPQWLAQGSAVQPVVQSLQTTSATAER